MKRTSFYTQNASMELQMTSMIDVIFLLLIFFICTSTFDMPEQLMPTPMVAMFGNAPTDQQVEIPPELLDLGEIAIQIHYDSKPYWDIGGQRYWSMDDVRNLLKVLSEESRELPVILDPDANVPIENVLDVHDAARNVRFSHVQFAVPK